MPRRVLNLKDCEALKELHQYALEINSGKPTNDITLNTIDKMIDYSRATLNFAKELDSYANKQIHKNAKDMGII